MAGRLLARSDANNSPFTRRKSPRNNASIDSNETLLKLVSTAVNKADAAQVLRALATVPLAVEGWRGEHWEHATDQDAFFDGVGAGGGAEVAARRQLMELCMQLDDRSEYETVALRFREWWPAAKAVTGLETCLPVLRAAAEPGVAVVALSLKTALQGAGVATGEAPLRWSVPTRCCSASSCPHLRTETAGEEGAEFSWSCTLTLDARESAGALAAMKMRGISLPKRHAEALSAAATGLKLARVAVALAACDKKPLAKTVAEVLEAMNSPAPRD